MTTHRGNDISICCPSQELRVGPALLRGGAARFRSRGLGGVVARTRPGTVGRGTMAFREATVSRRGVVEVFAGWNRFVSILYSAHNRHRASGIMNQPATSWKKV